jgi:DNA-binding response OmpR family regulator/EAL domain-containing protein (putative c-di-GMP-specific phosphodiesterase class I)
MNSTIEKRGEILVVDDDSGSLQLLAALLAEAGYRVETAANGELALLSISRHPPDLIVLDVRMPGMSGYDVCRTLQHIPASASIPVIFLSAAADTDDRIQGFDAGGVDFIAKPFVEEEVLARIGTHIEMALAAKDLLRRHRLSADGLALVDQAANASAERMAICEEILIVEDTPESLRLLAAVLTEAGYIVREAPNGELALWTASRRPPSLVLLDIRMPGMNGFDVCRCLKDDPATAHIPVIFLSALSDREDKAEGFAVGAVDYITKPFSESEVLARVRTHLRLAAASYSSAGSALKSRRFEERPPRVDLEAAIRNALSNGEFELLYQPIIDLASTRVVGAEALLRWHVPGMGTLEPAQFLRIAEETGAIIEIGNWVISEVCAQLVRWRGNLPVNFKIAINLCSLQFWQDGLVHYLEQALCDAGLPANTLELDIRESTLYEDLEQAVTTLHRLKSLGIQLAVDDFGADETRLSALRRFPVDCFKISRALLADLLPDDVAGDEASNGGEHTPGSQAGLAVMSAVVALAHKLKCQALVKGIETPAQQTWVQACACDLVQGYLTARPVAATHFNAYFIEPNGRLLFPAA